MVNYREERKKKGLCPSCGKERDRSNLIYCLTCLKDYARRNREWRKQNREYSRVYACDWRERKRLEIIEAFGGKCEKCGFDRYPEVLEFHEKIRLKEEGRARNWYRNPQLREKAIREKLIELLCPTCHRIKDRGLQP